MRFQTFLKFCLNPVVVYRGQCLYIRDMPKFLMSIYVWSHKLFLKKKKRIGNILHLFDLLDKKCFFSSKSTLRLILAKTNEGNL